MRKTRWFVGFDYNCEDGVTNLEVDESENDLAGYDYIIDFSFDLPKKKQLRKKVIVKILE